MAELLEAVADLAARGGPALWAIAAVGLWVYAALCLAALDARRAPQRARARLTPTRAGIAAAPLLGLLGTVGGLIDSLEGLMTAGRAEALAAGIGRAMLTTEYGLLVAAPALVLAGLVERAAERAAGELR